MSSSLVSPPPSSASPSASTSPSPHISYLTSHLSLPLSHAITSSLLSSPTDPLDHIAQFLLNYVKEAREKENTKEILGKFKEEDRIHNEKIKGEETARVMKLLSFKQQVEERKYSLLSFCRHYPSTLISPSPTTPIYYPKVIDNFFSQFLLSLQVATNTPSIYVSEVREMRGDGENTERGKGKKGKKGKKDTVNPHHPLLLSSPPVSSSTPFITYRYATPSDSFLIGKSLLKNHSIVTTEMDRIKGEREEEEEELKMKLKEKEEDEKERKRKEEEDKDENNENDDDVSDEDKELLSLPFVEEDEEDTEEIIRFSYNGQLLSYSTASPTLLPIKNIISSPSLSSLFSLQNSSSPPTSPFPFLYIPNVLIGKYSPQLLFLKSEKGKSGSLLAIGMSIPHVANHEMIEKSYDIERQIEDERRKKKEKEKELRKKKRELMKIKEKERKEKEKLEKKRKEKAKKKDGQQEEEEEEEEQEEKEKKEEEDQEDEEEEEEEDEEEEKKSLSSTPSSSSPSSRSLLLSQRKTQLSTETPEERKRRSDLEAINDEIREEDKILQRLDGIPMKNYIFHFDTLSPNSLHSLSHFSAEYFNDMMGYLLSAYQSICNLDKTIFTMERKNRREYREKLNGIRKEWEEKWGINGNPNGNDGTEEGNVDMEERKERRKERERERKEREKEKREREKKAAKAKKSSKLSTTDDKKAPPSDDPSSSSALLDDSTPPYITELDRIQQDLDDDHLPSTTADVYFSWYSSCIVGEWREMVGEELPKLLLFYVGEKGGKEEGIMGIKILKYLLIVLGVMGRVKGNNETVDEELFDHQIDRWEDEWSTIRPHLTPSLLPLISAFNAHSLSTPLLRSLIRLYDTLFASTDTLNSPYDSLTSLRQSHMVVYLVREWSKNAVVIMRDEDKGRREKERREKEEEEKERRRREEDERKKKTIHEGTEEGKEEEEEGEEEEEEEDRE